SQSPGREAFRRDVVENVERDRRRRLVVLVVRDQAAAEIRRQYFCRTEMRACKRRLSRSGDADKRDQRQRRNCQLTHAPTPLNTASWVGGPTSGSSVPTGRNSTP